MRAKFVLIALMLICAAASLYGGYSGIVKTNPDDLQTITRGNYDVVSLENNYTFTEVAGGPQLPTRVLSYVIPMESSVGSITITSVEEQLLNGEKYNIYPTQPPRKCDEEPVSKFVEQSADIYSSGRLYPEELYTIKSEEYKYGYHVVTVEFYPVQYDTRTKSLKINSDIEFIMNYTSAKEAYTVPEKQSEKMFNVCKNLIRSKVENPGDIDFVSGGPKKVVKPTKIVQKISTDSKSMPLPEFMTPEYIIITSKSLVDSTGANVFKTLADWKTKKGIPTQIVYVEDIYANYFESDNEHKLSDYLNDTYSENGSIYILLGGDTNIVPEFAYNTPLFVGRAPVENLTDAYTFINKTIHYEKLDNLTTAEKGYLNNMLILAGILGENYNDTTHYVYSTSSTPYGVYKNIDSLYSTLNVNCLRMCEKSIYSDSCLYDGHMMIRKDSITAALNGSLSINSIVSGASATDDHFGIVLHSDHSDYTNIGAGNHELGWQTGYSPEKFYREDAMSLTNGSFLNVLMSEGCSPGKFYKDCFAERMINNPDGGSVAVIAKVGYGYTTFVPQQRDFLESIYNPEDSLSLEDGYHISFALEYSNNTGVLFSDPELPVWNKVPDTFDNVVVEILNANGGDSLVTTGENTITIDTNESFESLVCLYKSGEAYAWGYTTNGEIEFEYTPDTEGTLYITITSKDYIPYETTETVSIPQDGTYGYLSISSVEIFDGISSLGIGDSDGFIDAGETVVLPIAVTNSSNIQMDSIYATLSVNDTLVTVNSSSLQFSALETNECDTVNFEIEIDPFIDDGTIVEFTLHLNSDAGSFTDKFNFRIKNSELTMQCRLDSFYFDQPNMHFYYNQCIEMQNSGNSVSGDFDVLISSNSNAIYNFSPDSIHYSSMDSLSINSILGQFSYEVDLTTVDMANDRLKITVSENNRSTDYYLSISYPDSLFYGLINAPLSSGDFSLSPDKDKIYLSWSYVSDGTYPCLYNIYRSDSIDGNYEKLNVVPLVSFNYTDYNCEETTTYYYKVAILFSSQSSFYSNGGQYKVGRLSEPIEASTSLSYATGWPVEASINISISNSPYVSDFDDDGSKEIFITGRDYANDEGYVMGFNSDGSEISQIGFPGAVCGFAKIEKASYATTYGSEIWNRCITGDIDNDDYEEVIVTARSGYNSLTVLKKTTTDVSPPDTLLIKHLDGDNPTYSLGDYIFADPVIADINNDGYNDIVILTEKGRLYVVDYQDSSYLDNSGQLPAGVTGNHYGGVAADDIDGDGVLEIVYGLQQGIYICEWDSTEAELTDPTPLFNYNYGSGEYYECKPTIANIDLEGNPEILVTSRINQTYDGKVYILNSDGSLYSSAWNGKAISKSGGDYYFFHPAFTVTNIDTLDYKPEIFIGGSGALYGWDSDGNNLNGFPISGGMSVWTTYPVIADVDGDSGFEIVMASNSDCLMYAYNVEDGSQVLGWPLIGNGEAPYIGDLDGDGYNEIVTADGAETLVYDCEGTFVPVDDPQNIEISESSGTITLSWDEVEDAVDYHIYRSYFPDTGYEEVGNTTNFTFDDPETDFGDSLYFYYVTAGLYSPSEIVGFAKFTNILTAGPSTNYISLPFEGYDMASDIDPDGEHVDTIVEWIPESQHWSGAYYVSPFGWLSDYSVTEGQAFCVNALDSASIYICGKYIDIPPYQLVTTSGYDYNLIMHPIEEYDLTTSEDIGIDIGSCNQVNEWDPNLQGWNTSSYGYFGWTNIFDTHIGYPLYVNILVSNEWPSESKAKGGSDEFADKSTSESKIPKALYFNIVNSKNESYDFSDVDTELEGIQPKDDYITFKAWVTGREDDILTEKNYDCGFEQAGGKYSTIKINVGNFVNKWLPGDEINIQITDNSSKDLNDILQGNAKLALSNDANGVFRGFEPVIKDSGNPIVVGSPEGEEMIPYETALYQNYPNPFNPATEIRFSLRNDTSAKLNIYNYKGQLVNELFNGTLTKGYHSVNFKADDLSSGVYFYTLEADGKFMTKKMVLTK